MNSQHQIFGMERLLHVLEQTRQLSLAESVAALLEQIEAWAPGARLQDDVSILAVEIAERTTPETRNVPA